VRGDCVKYSVFDCVLPMKDALLSCLRHFRDDDAGRPGAAFRKAAKANHPDFNPGNAEDSEIQAIVRANAILSMGSSESGL